MKNTIAIFTFALGVASVFAASPLSFKAVKPGPLVTNEPSFAPTPKEINDAFGKSFGEIDSELFKNGKKQEAVDAAFALAEQYKDQPGLWRRAIGRAFDLSSLIKDWEARKKAGEAIIGWKYSKTRDVNSQLEALAGTFEGLGDFKGCVDTLLKLQAQPLLATNQVQTYRMRAMNTLRDKLDDYDNFQALGKEIYGDDSICADYRADAYIAVASLLCQKKSALDDATALYEEALKLDTTPSKRYAIMRNYMIHANNHCKPSNSAKARSLCEDAITNGFYTIGDRVGAADQLLGYYRNDRAAEQKLIPVALVEKFLADNEAALNARDKARLLEALLKSKKEGGDAVSAETTAQAIFSCTNFPAPARRNAAGYIATRMAQRGDFKGAEELLLKTYSFLTKGAYEIEATAKDIGNLYILRDDLDGAIAAYKYAVEKVDEGKKARMDLLTIDAYKAFFRFADARDYALKVGQKAAAAEISVSNLDDFPTASKIYKEFLADETCDLGTRRGAWSALFASEPELTEKYFTAMLGDNANATNDLVRVLVDKLTRNGNSTAYFGNYGDGVRICSYLAKIYDANSAFAPDFKTVQYGAFAYCGTGDAKTAAAICGKALGHPRFAPAEVYQLSMMEALVARTGAVDALVKEIAKADAKFANGLEPKARVERIERVGCAAMISKNENLTRALDTYKKSLYKPAPTKRYTVHFNEKPISGLGAWDSLAVKPEVQLMDRSYGGNMDFLVTDVATGNRGEGISTEQGAKRAVAPTMQVACDEFGIHFRFEAPDEKANEIAAGFIGGGSYEGYIAPGDNQPYICTLFDIAPNAQLHLYNTSYETTGHRRITDETTDRFKSETVFTDNSTISYFMLSWEAYATLIPENGTEWEFENFLWGRAGSAAWNGSESIHGRSTWGRLVFDLPARGRIAILKHVIFKTLSQYNAEKRTTGAAEGVIDHWKDGAVGDLDFYNEVVTPLVEKLDGYIPLVKVDMSDADVIKVAEEALPAWRDIRFTIQRLRAEYLAEKLAK